MNVNISQDLLALVLQATPDQCKAIQLVFSADAEKKSKTGPLLMGMGDGANYLGVSRVTLWRMIRAGKLKKIELLPGSFRLLRSDLETIANHNN